jgi:hypothetical protein
MLAWDYARPAPPMFDVAYALDVAPFCEDAECLRWLRYPPPPTGAAAWPTATVRVDAGQVWWVRGPARL